MMKWQQDEVLRMVRKIVATQAMLRTKAQRNQIDPEMIKVRLDDDLLNLRLILSTYKNDKPAL
jgi:hypothetical protein